MQLVFDLAFQIVGVVAGTQPRVVGRIPNLVVHPVEDAAQPALPLPFLQQPLHAIAELRPGDLARIGRADGGHVVGIKQPGLEERHLAVELQAINVVKRRRQPQLGHVMGREQPLIGQVVHREYRARRVAVGGQIGAGQAGVPVVSVHQLRSPVAIQPLGQLAGHPAQQRKAAVVIGVGIHGLIVVRATRPVIQPGASMR